MDTNLIKTETSNQFLKVLEKHFPIYEVVIHKKSPSGQFIDSYFWETILCLQKLAKNTYDDDVSFENDVIELMEHHNFMIGEFCLIAPNSDEAIMLDNLRKDFLAVCANYFSIAKNKNFTVEELANIRNYTQRNFYKDFKEKQLKRLNIISHIK